MRAYRGISKALLALDEGQVTRELRDSLIELDLSMREVHAEVSRNQPDSVGELDSPQYLALEATTKLKNERVLTAGSGITLTDNGPGDTAILTASAGGGDFSGPAGSTLNNLLIFADTTGKLGADGGKGLPSGAIVGTTDSQTLSAKTLTTPTIGDFTNAQHDHANAGAGGAIASGATPTAIHDDIAAEISAVTEKTVPAGGDFILIEDAAAADAKKRIDLANLPGVGVSAITATATLDADGAADGTTETNLLSQAIPADMMDAVGRNIFLRMRGRIEGAGARPSLVLRVKIGSTTIGTLTLIPPIGTNGFVSEFDLTTRSSGNVFGQGSILYPGAIALGSEASTTNIAATAVTTSGAITLNVTGQWGTATSGNLWELTNAIVEVGGTP